MAASTTAIPCGFAGGEFGDQLVLAAHHRRMHQLVQARQPLGVAEDLRGQGAPVDFAVRLQDPGAEFAHHGIVGFAAGRQHLMPQLVGLDQLASQSRPAPRPQSSCRRPGRR